MGHFKTLIAIYAQDYLITIAILVIISPSEKWILVFILDHLKKVTKIKNKT